MSARCDPAALWRGLDELQERGEIARLIEAEFPAAAFAEGVDRRGLLRVMAASLLLAGLPGCDDDSGDAAISYVEQPEQEVPGVPRMFATAVTLAGIAQPVLGTTYSGRPTKLEGNPEHPASGGATDAYTQAAVLGLYDPDRSQAPSLRGRPATWAEAGAALAKLHEGWMADRGASLRILTGATTSPTLARQFGELLAALPEARIHVFEPGTPDAEHAGTALAFGRPLDVRRHFEQARVIVALDDDFLGPGPRQVIHTRGWTAARASATRPRLYVAEPTPSLTGAAASARLPAASARIEHLAHAVAAGFGLVPAGDLTPAEQAWADRAIRALKTAGNAALVTIGAQHRAEIQALVHRINAAVGSAGSTVRYAEPLVYHPLGADSSLAALARDIEAGAVEALIVLDTNPVYAAPGDLYFAELLGRVPNRIHAGLYRDETGALCDWHLPLTHALESWSDARAADGTASIIQPLVRPFFATRTVHQVLDLLLGNGGDDARGIVFATWHGKLGAYPDAKWRQSLNDGFIADSAPAPVIVSPVPQTAAEGPLPAPSNAVEIVFRPDAAVWEGRFANNAWLQEMPKPLTTVTWDAPVLVSPAFAAANGIENGDIVEIAAGDNTLSGPAWVMPGQAENTITLFLGYGRWQAGQVGSGSGYHAASLQCSASPWIEGASWRKTGAHRALAATQLQHGMAGEDLVLTVAPGRTVPKHETPPTLYPKWPSTDARNDPSWGMVIDLDRCTGCNACAIACQAENNVPVVGREQVLVGRAMHWLRIARYHKGGIDNPETYFQPVPCMHCEKAPCEQGCPVHATVHSPDGLNQMVYNRCIGTRTCSSYCPYKVRRFNFFDFTSDEPGGREPQRNPNVTVRTRGVMEKCTYCVQRISAARVVADKEERPLRDGDVVTACQAACPAQAIAFGNIADPESAVSKARAEGRNYTLLDNIGAQPRTSYLARIGDEEPKA